MPPPEKICRMISMLAGNFDIYIFENEKIAPLSQSNEQIMNLVSSGFVSFAVVDSSICNNLLCLSDDKQVVSLLLPVDFLSKKQLNLKRNAAKLSAWFVRNSLTVITAKGLRNERHHKNLLRSHKHIPFKDAVKNLFEVRHQLGHGILSVQYYKVLSSEMCNI